MQAGTLATSDVQSYTSRVLVNGIQREHKTWSITRELSGDLPDQVMAVSGITQATGTIAWKTGPDVSERSANPWNASTGWLPKSGDRVEIYAGDTATEWIQFTGRIDTTSGDVGKSAQSTIVDDIDNLNTRFSHDALLRIMPPRDNGGVRRGIGLGYAYYLDAALRRAGFYATPPKEARAAVSIPAQFSMWPEDGTLTVASDLSGGTSHAAFWPAPWGLSAANFLVEVGPRIREAPSSPVELTFMVAPDHNGNANMNVIYGSSVVQLAVAGSRTVFARLNGVEVCSLVMGSAVTVSLLIKAGVWTLRTDTGTTATGTATIPGTTIMDLVTFSGDTASRLAGFQVCYPNTSTEFNPVNYKPTAVMDLSLSFAGLIDAAPVIKPTTSRKLIDEISNAALTATHIDEAGVFRVIQSDVLRNRAPVQTITTLDDIRSLSWSDDLLSVRSLVSIDYHKPFIDLSIYQNRLCYQGGSQTLESGQKTTELISPGTDEDWIGISFNMPELGDAGSAANSNKGVGSVTGGVATDGTTDTLGEPYLITSLEQITPGTLKLTHEVTTLPAGNVMELRYPKASTTIWQRWLNEPFPFVRSFARTDWAGETYTSTITGPSYAPELVHDTGPWLAREDNTIVIQRVADFIADQVTKPGAVITGMRVGYDPRRQLGDVITISSPSLMGVELQCLIVGIDNGAGKSFTQSLGVRIISAVSTFTTYAEFNDAGGDLTYQQWSLLEPLTQSYTQFNDAV
ncbi:hypothetical protein [Arthrobacter roseus]|uniref:hypothetical protein n=1 Tax=Arthrobacter roseus TaxID=136274 RepID=UPI001966777F|nr:hypothetical protein [Arthrobacter roseus]MBM7847454.1 hypothetical protein [Arthrobacter roseus]